MTVMGYYFPMTLQMEKAKFKEGQIFLMGILPTVSKGLLLMLPGGHKEFLWMNEKMDSPGSYRVDVGSGLLPQGRVPLNAKQWLLPSSLQGEHLAVLPAQCPCTQA